jgi:hypothetical protein
MGVRTEMMAAKFASAFSLGLLLFQCLSVHAADPGTPQNIMAMGAKCDGVTDDSKIIIAAESAGAILIPKSTGACLFNANATFAHAVAFAAGGVLKPANGRTIVINAPISADISQIFDLSAGGLIRGTFKVPAIYPEWWRAGSSPTETRKALQASFDYAINSGQQSVKQLWTENYVLDAGLVWTLGSQGACPVIEGAGIEGVTLYLGSPAAETAAITVKGQSGTLCGGHLTGVAFQSSSAANSVGLELQGVNGFTWDIRSATMKRAVLLCNCAPGEFTEFDHGNINADATTTIALEYRVRGGNESFHGSGLDAGTVINFMADSNAILIADPAAYVYDAPLEGTFFPQDAGPTKNATMIQNNSRFAQNGYAIFKGNFGIESQNSGTTILAAGSPVFLLGNFMEHGNQQQLFRGTLYTGNAFEAIGNGGWRLHFNPIDQIQSFSGQSARILRWPPSFGPSISWRFNAAIIDMNNGYDVVCEGSVVADGVVGMAINGPPACHSFSDTHGWGVPSFNVDGGGLSASNSRFSASTEAWTEATQSGQDMQHHSSQ